MRIFRGKPGDALFCAAAAVVLAGGWVGSLGAFATRSQSRPPGNPCAPLRGVFQNTMGQVGPTIALNAGPRWQLSFSTNRPALPLLRLWEGEYPLRRLDLNQRPEDYESSELPDCSTPRLKVYHQPQPVVVQSCIISLQFRFTCFQRFSRDGTAAVQRRQPQPVGVSANSQNKPFRFNEVVIMLVIPPWRLRPPSMTAFHPACDPEQRQEDYNPPASPVVIMPFFLQVQSTSSFIRQGTPERNRFNSEVFSRPGHPLFVHPFFFWGNPMPRLTTAPSARNEVLISLHGRSIPDMHLENLWTC